MGFWRRLFGGSGADDIKAQRLDYLNEALALERQGDYDSALTSYRLALRDHPNDARILQNMAIAFTKTRRIDEAIRHYRRALELDRELDRKSTRLNSSHLVISYAVFCLKKKKEIQ